MTRDRVHVAPDLTLQIANASVRLTPTRALHLAEKLARTAFRAAMVEEIDRPTGRLTTR